MEEYIQEALVQQFIVPSTSPESARFFFVEKMGGLASMAFRGLNNILIKYSHPLPLVPVALEQLKNAKVFTKLDLRSTYNLRIREGDEWKTAFSTTSGHYQHLVMPYGIKKLPWNKDAEQAFNLLKEAFTSAPILKHRNPEPQFVV